MIKLLCITICMLANIRAGYKEDFLKYSKEIELVSDFITFDQPFGINYEEKSVCKSDLQYSLDKAKRYQAELYMHKCVSKKINLKLTCLYHTYDRTYCGCKDKNAYKNLYILGFNYIDHLKKGIELFDQDSSVSEELIKKILVLHYLYYDALKCFLNSKPNFKNVLSFLIPCPTDIIKLIAQYIKYDSSDEYNYSDMFGFYDNSHYFEKFDIRKCIKLNFQNPNQLNFFRGFYTNFVIVNPFGKIDLPTYMIKSYKLVNAKDCTLNIKYFSDNKLGTLILDGGNYDEICVDFLRSDFILQNIEVKTLNLKKK